MRIFLIIVGLLAAASSSMLPVNATTLIEAASPAKRRSSLSAAFRSGFFRLQSDPAQGGLRVDGVLLQPQLQWKPVEFLESEIKIGYFEARAFGQDQIKGLTETSISQQVRLFEEPLSKSALFFRFQLGLPTNALSAQGDKVEALLDAGGGALASVGFGPTLLLSPWRGQLTRLNLFYRFHQRDRIRRNVPQSQVRFPSDSSPTRSPCLAEPFCELTIDRRSGMESQASLSHQIFLSSQWFFDVGSQWQWTARSQVFSDEVDNAFLARIREQSDRDAQLGSLTLGFLSRGSPSAQASRLTASLTYAKTLFARNMPLLESTSVRLSFPVGN